MNELTVPKETALATESENPFLAQAARSNTNRLVGSRLKFAKGFWTSGMNEDDVELGTQYVANMDSLMHGWILWQDKRPADMHMGLVCEGFMAPTRRSLGLLDQEEWEVNEEGAPIDPWQETAQIVLKAVDSSDLYTFSTSSLGGRQALLKTLCAAYGAEFQRRPAQWPIVAVGRDSYKHQDSRRGKIYVPLLPIVGWAAKDDFPAPGNVDAEPESAPF